LDIKHISSPKIRKKGSVGRWKLGGIRAKGHMVNIKGTVGDLVSTGTDAIREEAFYK
jgi:hypothetical protein